MKFTHLEYGRDHGPDHLHKGKLKTKNPLKCISWSRPSAQGKIEHFLVYYRRRRKFFSLLRNSSYCNSFTFGNLRSHPHSRGDSGGDSAGENRGVTPTVGVTFLEEKSEESPPLWG